ncbi:GNAT family N-acetyltransferase [Legionella septentrionalis]|uniref:GNAT family N-acetyltransferase n=1 Tax=Legionella septentrionalis TaxID=2498109 RepID=A0A3S0X5K1_9GAMM|nr:GNAT family N-acetyltransferase [Legionella septentrionalis]RUQ90423.1 GNAT family N-acetyltransferase [Legionella septentrionalis]RUQ94666.1 GNAT family N-acetyltransferase [Legionella septentrionalis]RUR16477.1 GNAT family N-acetyltransferase [Legionella septentrionalis]
MNEHYAVERMSKDEVQLAIAWAAEEGWNPGLNDAECFYQADPHGFFAGKLNGKIIAVGSAVNYDEEFAFCGFYIVNQSQRGKGYGLALTRARLAYVGNRNAGIDGVIHMLDKYARLGYQLAHYNARYTWKAFYAATDDEYTLPLAHIDFALLQEYDRRHFPAYRPAFLQCWIKQAGAKSMGYFKDAALQGYGVIRPCQRGFKIGPLFADHPAIAETLFLNLASHAQGQDVFLDIPENNPHALALVKRFQLTKVFATARMYLKEEPTLEKKNIYGITTFELG